MQTDRVRSSLLRYLARCCLCAAVLLPMPASAQDPIEDEALLKSAFIFNFAKFTRWPASAWAGQSSKLLLCTIGKGVLVDNLARLSDRTIRGRAVAIRPVTADSGFDGCHVLFISGSRHRKLQLLLDLVGTAPVLTISEIRGFADAGGVIQLYRDKSRVRFRINIDAARAKDLNLRARLLDLAEVVDREARP